MQRLTVLRLPYRYLLRLDDGAGIQARIHLHERDSGFGITGLNRALDRGGTAPARQ